MKLLAIHAIHDSKAKNQTDCAIITELGLRGKDDIVTVIDAKTAAFCLSEGSRGLCIPKFKADLIVDELVTLQVNETIEWGSCEFSQTDRRHKHCFPGCELDPLLCQLNNRVLFLKIKTAGQICIGDEIKKTYL